MIRRLMTTAFATVLLLSTAARAGDAEQEAAARARAERVEKARAFAATVDPQVWRTDPACQMVFFAVLEGLYTDGVPDEAVDLIVPPKARGQESVQHTFVFKCPLCHAAYEAFVVYQNRTAFHGSNEARSTLGKSFDPKLLAGLKSKVVRERVFAMGAMMRPWVERRMKLMRMDDKEQAELLTKLLTHAERGDQLFQTYKYDPTPSVYKEWMFYGGCQACEAATEVAKGMRR